MGYWRHGENGQSFVQNSELLWGDSPADYLDAAVESVVEVITAQAGRPDREWLKASFEVSLSNFRDDFDNIDEVIHDNTDGKIFNLAIANAARVFHEDVGRHPTKDELRAGLKFSLITYEE